VDKVACICSFRQPEAVRVRVTEIVSTPALWDDAVLWVLLFVILGLGVVYMAEVYDWWRRRQDRFGGS
jgi:hypothetical protein